MRASKNGRSRESRRVVVFCETFFSPSHHDLICQLITTVGVLIIIVKLQFEYVTRFQDVLESARVCVCLCVINRFVSCFVVLFIHAMMSESTAVICYDAMFRRARSCVFVSSLAILIFSFSSFTHPGSGERIIIMTSSGENSVCVCVTRA